MARYCVICGAELITEGNEMLSNILGQELSEGQDAMITYAHCPHCNCDYEMQDASNAEITNDDTYIGLFTLHLNKNDEII